MQSQHEAFIPEICPDCVKQKGAACPWETEKMYNNAVAHSKYANRKKKKKKNCTENKSTLRKHNIM